MNKTAYPLCWPEARARQRLRRTNNNFQKTFAQARDGCIAEIRRLGGDGIIISSNVPLRADGLPFAMDWGSNRTKQGQAINDPAVAVYFRRNGKQMCFACDAWNHVQDNMHAICLTIHALRGIARWGTGDMMEAAFRGFAALPASTGRDWWTVLGVAINASDDQVRAAYTALVKRHHPDVLGGDAEKFREVQRAWEDFERARRAAA